MPTTINRTKTVADLPPPDIFDVSGGDLYRADTVARLLADERRKARAEFKAKLKPVAYLPRADIDELRKSGRRAAVLCNERVSRLDVPLAIIPKD